MEDKLMEEELGMRSKREPPKLFTPYITKTEPYTPGHPPFEKLLTIEVIPIVCMTNYFRLDGCGSSKLLVRSWAPWHEVFL